MSIAARPPARSRAHVTTRLGLLLGLLAILVLVDAPERTRFWDALFDAGHAPLFGFIALLTRGVLTQAFPAWTGRRWSGVALGFTIALGAVTEALQVLLPARESSGGDLLRDAVGAAAFLLLRGAWMDPGTARGLPRARGARSPRAPQPRRRSARSACRSVGSW